MGWGVVVTGVLVLWGISIILGQGGAPSGTSGGSGGAADKCAECRADFAWYNGLKKWKKALYSGWWLLRKGICLANGC
jgi:hypothetical protein